MFVHMCSSSCKGAHRGACSYTWANALFSSGPVKIVKQRMRSFRAELGDRFSPRASIGTHWMAPQAAGAAQIGWRRRRLSARAIGFELSVGLAILSRSVSFACRYFGGSRVRDSHFGMEISSSSSGSKVSMLLHSQCGTDDNQKGNCKESPPRSGCSCERRS